MTFFRKMNHLKRYVYICYRKILTNLYYKLFLHSLGSKSFIGRPLYLTAEYISLGNCVYIWPNSRIEGVSKYLNKRFSPRITIKNNVSIQQNLHLTCANEIIIESETAIAANVTITDINHQYIDIHISPEKQDIEVGKVYIGEACKIYNNVVILPDVILGKHTIVAANSVVTSGRYPSFCVLAGSPAKIIKRYCFDHLEWRKTDAKGEFI